MDGSSKDILKKYNLSKDLTYDVSKWRNRYPTANPL